MGCIGDSLLWQGEGGIQRPRQIDNLLADVEDRQPLKSSQALARSLRISSGGLIQHKLGDIDVEAGAAGLPPFLCKLLVTGPDQVSAGPSRKVAGDGCFQVEF